MKKIYTILPISPSECFITKGFADGFRKLGYFVQEKDVREVTIEEIEKFNPEFIFGYNYSYLINKKLSESLINNNKYKFIHYFGSEPDSKFAYEDRPELLDLIKQTNANIFVWDSKCLNEIEGSIYLPLGVNPKQYKTTFNGYQHKISFVGRPQTQKRQEIIVQLIKNFGPISLFCNRDNFEKSLNEMLQQNLFNSEELEWYKESYKGYLKTPEELSEVYNSSKININVTEKGKDNINYRVFEVLASSAFLLTDETPDLYRHFEVGKELEVYTNIEDLVDKTRFYLKNLNFTQAIARAGRKNVVNNHSFKDRASKLLKLVK